MAEEVPGHVLRRRPAAKPNVDFSDPVRLHDSPRLRIELVPMFVRRTQGDQLRVKLVRYRKPGMIQEPPISMDEQATRKLHQALGEHLALAGEQENGRFIALRIDDGKVQLGGLSPHAVASAMAKLLADQQIVSHLSSQDLGEQLFSAFRGALRLKELHTAVAALRNHLDSGEHDEHVYQLWCQRHSWAFGNAHVVNDRIRDISAGDQVDLLVPRLLGGFRDLIELKRPNHTVLNWDDAHNNWYFNAEVSKALGQCHRYLDVLHDDGRKGLTHAPDVVAYHPRATIVIGRSQDWPAAKHTALHGLNSRLAGISVMTYDHLLAQAERTLEIMSAEVGPDAVDLRDTANDEPYEGWDYDEWDYDQEPF